MISGWFETITGSETAMILIWDNGMDYSSHEVDFIELGDTDPAHAVELLKMSNSDGYALGLAERIDWWRGGAAALFDVVSPSAGDGKTPDVPTDLKRSRGER